MAEHTAYQIHHILSASQQQQAQFIDKKSQAHPIQAGDIARASAYRPRR